MLLFAIVISFHNVHYRQLAVMQAASRVFQHSASFWGAATLVLICKLIGNLRSNDATATRT